jgi:hypothetical protein
MCAPLKITHKLFIRKGIDGSILQNKN